MNAIIREKYEAPVLTNEGEAADADVAFNAKLDALTESLLATERQLKLLWILHLVAVISSFVEIANT